MEPVIQINPGRLNVRGACCVVRNDLSARASVGANVWLVLRRRASL